MRIIAGDYKGRRLKVPNSKLVRPTTDRTKEALFNYLNNLIDFENTLTADLYAGSGSLGFEALSRGSREVHFIEKNFQIYKILNENIDMLKVSDVCTIYKMSSLKFSNLKMHNKYDLILADPPFFKDDIHEVVKNLLMNEFLTVNGLLIVERSIQTEKKDTKIFEMHPVRRQGDSLIYQFSPNKIQN